MLDSYLHAIFLLVCFSIHLINMEQNMLLVCRPLSIIQVVLHLPRDPAMNSAAQALVRVLVDLHHNVIVQRVKDIKDHPVPILGLLALGGCDHRYRELVQIDLHIHSEIFTAAANHL